MSGDVDPSIVESLICETAQKRPLDKETKVSTVRILSGTLILYERLETILGMQCAMNIQWMWLFYTLPPKYPGIEILGS